MADKIQVAVRVRPVLLQKKDVEIHWSWSEGMVFQSEPGTQKRIGNPYLFDQVFGTETQNYQLFTKLVQPLIDSAMNGFNVTVLAYGQTASGKTYTMMGSQKELGIVQLAVDRIFTLIEQHPERAFLLRCSYIEIYNETISDLLSSSHQKLKVQELAEGNVVVHNLIETNVNTPDAVLKLMQQGNKQRKVGGTSMNERSSRSHTIFRIIVESVPRDEADRSDAAVIVSHINLVDLAGSEKASQTHATGDRFREGCAINTSLSALSLVIKQLSEGEGFVNFRDSKLTHILRASLGGNARTAIICNVTPTVLDETSSTLKFACSAKAVQNQPHVNEVLSDQALLRKYNNYIKDLEKKLKEKELEQRPEAIEEMQRLLQEKDMKINELKEQLVVSSDVASGRPECSLTSAQRSLRRMTWGGNRLKQELNLLGPTIFEVNTPPVPCSEKVPRTVAQVFASRQRTNNISQSEGALNEVAAEIESLESETFFPAEMIFSKSPDPVTKVDVATMTDVKESPFKQPSVPSTPVPVLRERLQRMRMSLLNKEKENEDLREELEDLTKFTRLEQEIGVHVQATAKNVASPESADHLHRALQTANDMEVLYLDTQRKLSELQTEFRTKEAEHENEMHSMQTDYQSRLETEITEKKRLAKDLTNLRDKFDRLEKDHSEADTHVQVISERHAKREADLREALQEAWAQLELLGQDPNAIKENFDAKQKLALVEQELLEIQKRNSDAQSQIASLTEELHQIKESALQIHEAAVKDDDQMHDSSLNGMCLADELRDVFMNQESSFVSRSVHQTRKRPSSILSVALAKMDQSTCILDSTEQDIEPSKKTRLSIDQSEELDISEVKEIRKYLVELQAVLERYEADYEVLSQEKELLNSQLVNAQHEIANLREAKNKSEPSTRHKDLENSVKGLDTSEEMLDSSCFIGEPSISTSIMDMEQSCDSDDQFLSLRDTQVSSISAEISEAAALRIEKVAHSNKIKQLEEELTQMSEKLELLQQSVEEKTIALEQKQHSLEAAQSNVEVLEQRDEERKNLLSNFNDLNEKIHLLSEDSTLVTRELEITRQNLKEIRTEAHALSVAKQLLESQLEKANEELDAVRVELATVNRAQLQSSNEELLSELDLAKTKIKDLENDLQSTNAILSSINEEAASKDQEYSAELNRMTQVIHQLEVSLKETGVHLAELQSKKEVVETELKESQRRIVDLEGNLDSECDARVAVERAAEEAASIAAAALQANVEEKKKIEQQLIEYRERVTKLSLELGHTISELEAAKAKVLQPEKNVRLEGVPCEDIDALNSDLKEAHHRVFLLEESLKEKTTQLNVSYQKFEAAQASIHALEQKGENFSMEAKSFECKIQDLSAQNVNLDEMIVQLKSDLHSKEGELCSLTQKIALLESRLQEVNGETARMSRIIDDKSVEILRLEEELSRMTDSQNDHQKQLQHAEQRFHDRQQELDEVRISLQSMQSVNDELVTKLSDMEQLNVDLAETQIEKVQQSNKIKQLEEELTQMSEKLELLQQSVEEKTVALEQKQRAIEAVQSTSEDLVAMNLELKEALHRVFQLEKSLEEKSTELNVSYQKFEAAQASIHALEQKEENFSMQAKSFECTIQDLSAQNVNLDEMVVQFKSDLQSKESELINLRSMAEKVALLESRLQEVDYETARMSRIIDDKSVEILRLEEELTRITDSQNDHHKQSQYAEQRFRDKQRELDEIRISLQFIQSVNDELVTKLNDKEKLDADLAAAQIEKVEQSNKIKELEEELTHMSKKLELSQQSVEEKTIALEQQKRSLEAAQSTSENFHSLNSDLKEALQRVFQLEESLEEKTTELNVLYQKFEAAQAGIRALEQKEENFFKQTKSFECTIQDLSAQIVNLEKTVAQLKSDLQSKEFELINFRSSTQKVALLESRLQEVDVETAHMSRIIDGKTDEILRLEEELARVTDSQRDNQIQLQHAEHKFHDKQLELDEIRISLQSMQSVNDDLVAKLSDKENLNVDLRKNIENSSQRFDLLHSKLESVQSEKSFLSERVRLLESQLESQEEEIGDLRRGFIDVQNERDLTTQLKHRLSSLQAQYDDAVSQCQQLKLARDEILTHQEQSREELLRLGAQLQVIVEEKAALEQYRMDSESQKEAILRDYQNIKTELTDKESQLHSVQCQCDEFNNQVKRLNEQISEVRSKGSASESSSKFQVQRHLEETVDKLKKELVEARSKSEIIQLNFETEEDQRKKKVERLEKELETVKQQYVKCKEQLRLLRYRPNEEGTVSLPKPRVSVVVESISVQTDPIADKGFGFRWQMEQYVSDNERLRKKVSELGERMEFYKDKLIKYRTLYFQTTGQDPQRPSSSSSNHSSQPMERHSSSSSNCRENVADCAFGDSDRNPNKKTLVTSSFPTSINPQPVALQETHQEEATRLSSGVAKPAMTATASTRWSGGKKESLTKEEMEKINNCNPS